MAWTGVAAPEGPRRDQRLTGPVGEGQRGGLGGICQSGRGGGGEEQRIRPENNWSNWAGSPRGRGGGASGIDEGRGRSGPIKTVETAGKGRGRGESEGGVSGARGSEKIQNVI